jgi:hypothetical protein
VASWEKGANSKVSSPVPEPTSKQDRMSLNQGLLRIVSATAAARAIFWGLSYVAARLSKTADLTNRRNNGERAWRSNAAMPL